MQTKKSSRKGRNQKIRVIDTRIIISVILLVLMGFFTLLSIFNASQIFLRVRKFEIVGECPYEASELAAGADIARGERLYSLDKKKTSQTLLENCAYLESAEIKTSFPNKIKFIVKSYVPVWYIEISGDFYVIDSDLNVLEETKNEARLCEAGIIKLTLPHVKTAIVNKKLTFGNGEEEVKATLEVMESILSSEVLFMISKADISNRYDIHFEFDEIPIDETTRKLDGVFKVSVGGYSKLDAKLEYILKALMREDLENVSGGSIDISDGGEKVSIRPSYVIPTEDNEETTED